jgi:hypothetical protein
MIWAKKTIGNRHEIWLIIFQWGQRDVNVKIQIFRKQKGLSPENDL